MPELPEVETTRLGIMPHVLGKKIEDIIVRRHDLRLPISDNMETLTGRRIGDVNRRSKYLLLETDDERVLLIHLGMSGSLRIIPAGDDWKKHDHVGISLEGGMQLRYHDPRRFGMVLLLAVSELAEHKLLRDLGPEPLDDCFDTAHLLRALERKSIPIKTAIMDAKVVVGVGNIYASESLFRSGINPLLPANQLSKAAAKRLVKSIKETLAESIKEGGTTLRDFLKSDGEPGYFKQRLFVYGRKGEACRVCDTEISHAVVGQRATFWCPHCQP
jgi:formamidopyrimidine-DNA glycosylase